MAFPPPPTFLEVPRSPSKPRPFRSPSQRFPPTALFQGPVSRNESHHDIPTPSHGDQNDSDLMQRLPQAQAPPSLAGPSVRTSLVQSRLSVDPRSPYPHSKPSVSTFGTVRNQEKGKDDFHPDALWAEMQRTLADVELSAANTSTVFGAAHSRTLEDLRTAQLGLAQAWAKSEADEVADKMDVTDDEADGTVGKAESLTKSPSKHTTPNTPSGKGDRFGQPHSRRRGSSSASASAMGKDLEEETEKDIQLAAKRRAANDRYFQQVNQGVLDVVNKLDEVANAMKRVERESREIWDDRSADGVSMTTSAGEQLSRGEESDRGTDRANLDQAMTKTTTTDSGIEGPSDSPATPKRKAPSNSPFSLRKKGNGDSPVTPKKTP